MTAVSTFSPTGDPYVDSLLEGLKWGTAVITYSFPTDASLYVGAFNGYFPYGAGEENNNFTPFNAVQQAAVNSILTMYGSVINVTFTEITETSTNSATLRYAESSSASPTAYTYAPSTSPEGGDMWFNTSGYNNPVLGNYAWDTLMHETGHALGLKHPFEQSGQFGTMPTDHDSLEYTIMTYRSYVGGPTTGYSNGTWSYPQSLMMYDIAALQTMYGANYTTNSGDTIYTWSPTTGQEFINGVAQLMPGGNKIFLTIWDGGGNDTYNFSNYTTNLSIDLRPGDWTTVSTTQLANLGGGHNAAGNIANSLLYQGNTASLIENAVGGTGNDTIIGNAADNKLTGGAGNNSLDGVSGTNTAVYSGASTDYQVVSNGDGTWTVTDLRSGSPDGTDTLSNVEFLQFSDGTVALGATTTPTPTVSSISPDTGANSSDDITNATVLTVSGTAEAGSTVTIYDGSSQSGTYLGNTTADTNGNWTFNTGTLAAGTHNFTATATDTNGTSADSSALIVTIDTATPTGGTPALATASDSGTSSSDNITKVTNPTFQVALNSSVAVGDTVQLLLGGVALAHDVTHTVTAGDISAGHVSLTVTAGDLGADGSKSITAKFTDTAGNTSTTAADVITLDTTAPTGGTPALTSGSDSGSSASDNITSVVSPTFQVSINSSVVVGDTVQLLLGGAALAHDITHTITAGDITAGFVDLAVTAGDLGTDGAKSITAKFADTAGNVSTTAADVITIDTAVPAAPGVALSNDTGSSGSDKTTSDPSLTLTGIESGATVEYSLDGGSNWSTSAPTLAQLVQGSNTVEVRQTDLAGNVSNATAFSFTLDTSTAAPVVALTTDSGSSTTDQVTNVGTLALSGLEAGATVSYSIDGGTTFTSSFSAVEGLNNVIVRATDVAGNTNDTAFSFTLDTSTAAPVVALTTDSGSSTTDQVTNVGTLALSGLESRRHGQLQHRRRHDLHQQLQRGGGAQQRHRAGDRRRR